MPSRACHRKVATKISTTPRYATTGGYENRSLITDAPSPIGGDEKHICCKIRNGCSHVTGWDVIVTLSQGGWLFLCQKYSSQISDFLFAYFVQSVYKSQMEDNFSLLTKSFQRIINAFVSRWIYHSRSRSISWDFIERNAVCITKPHDHLLPPFSEEDAVF